MSSTPARPAAARNLERRLLVKLQAGDSVAAVVTAKVRLSSRLFVFVFGKNFVFLQVGQVASSKVCLAQSDEEIPAGQQSVLLTH